MADVIEFPSVNPGEPLEISATQYAMHRQCPERANARLRDHKYDAPTIPTFRGALAHAIFARHQTVGPIDDRDFRTVCKEEIGSSKGLNPQMVSLGMRNSTLMPIIEEVADLYRRFRSLPLDGLSGTEVELIARPVQGVTLKGKVDSTFSAEGGGTRLVDWKTGQLGEEGARNDQLDFYALLWLLVRGELPTQLEAVSVGTGERSTPMRPSESSVRTTSWRVAEVVNQLRSSWANNVELPRNGGPWCRYCPLLTDCPEGQAAKVVFLASAE